MNRRASMDCWRILALCAIVILAESRSAEQDFGVELQRIECKLVVESVDEIIKINGSLPDKSEVIAALRVAVNGNRAYSALALNNVEMVLSVRVRKQDKDGVLV